MSDIVKVELTPLQMLLARLSAVAFVLTDLKVDASDVVLEDGITAEEITEKALLDEEGHKFFTLDDDVAKIVYKNMAAELFAEVNEELKKKAQQV